MFKIYKLCPQWESICAASQTRWETVLSPGWTVGGAVGLCAKALAPKLPLKIQRLPTCLRTHRPVGESGTYNTIGFHTSIVSFSVQSNKVMLGGLGPGVSGT